MNNQINIEQIKQFSTKYNSNKSNKTIEKAITKNGLEKACIKREIVLENQPIFNIELPETKRYNQKDNHKCWIYAGINVIKYDIAKNLNIDIMNLELSDNYIAFFDKLEKCNYAYETILNSKNTSLEYLNKENVIKYCATEAGYWPMFVAIVEKYGIVPKKFMPDVVESMNYQKLEIVLSEKLKKDCIILISMKNQNESIENLEDKKQEFLQEDYELLSKILGEPPFYFTYEYQDKNGKKQTYKDITPIEFKNKFLTLNLKEFVSIGNVPMYNKEYEKVYKKKYTGNVYGKSDVSFLNLPIEDLKRFAIQQLKEGIPVWMGAHIRKFESEEAGILDTRLYNYRETLNLKCLTKEEALNLRDIELHHAMIFCGVHLEDDKPIRWKVEDSYGEQEKINGYYVMNDKFFDEFVFNVIVQKKYLTNRQIKLLEQKPIEFEIEEPF